MTFIEYVIKIQQNIYTVEKVYFPHMKNRNVLNFRKCLNNNLRICIRRVCVSPDLAVSALTFSRNFFEYYVGEIAAMFYGDLIFFAHLPH